MWKYTISLIFALLLPSLAMAQSDRVREPPRRPAAASSGPVLTGNPIADAEKALAPVANAVTGTSQSADQLWQKIVAANIADLTYAKALADNAASAGSKLRSQCYAQVITTVEQANGKGIKDASGNAFTKPNPDIITIFEQVAEIADNLQATSPLMAACAPAANAVKMSVANLITAMVAGGATLATFGVTGL